MSKYKANAQANKRQEIQARQRKKRLTTFLIWGGLGIIIATIMGIIIWKATRPVTWEVVSIPSNYTTHIEEGTPPGAYPSDPPAGGVHYANEMPTKFYQETDAETQVAYPEGHLVHNLEHGYVIFWYNCAVLDEAGCTKLKDDIQNLMDEFKGVKLIAFPWKSLKEPLAMTSWGKLQRFNTFNAAQARAFIKANRNRSPEPDAP